MLFYFIFFSFILRFPPLIMIKILILIFGIFPLSIILKHSLILILIFILQLSSKITSISSLSIFKSKEKHFTNIGVLHDISLQNSKALRCFDQVIERFATTIKRSRPWLGSKKHIGFNLFLSFLFLLFLLLHTFFFGLLNYKVKV